MFENCTTISAVRDAAEMTRQSYYRDEISQLTKQTALADCQIVFQSGVWLLMASDICLYDEAEFSIPEYHYFRQAVELLDPRTDARWKTADKLITLIMALRETTAQGTDAFDVVRNQPISEKDYHSFVNLARHYDAQHHGMITF